MKELSIKPLGFCYYHAQDLARAVDPTIQNLYLGFNSLSEDDKEAVVVAKMIVDRLKQKNFNVTWSGSVDERILIDLIEWKKIPDDQNWRAERVIAIMSKVNSQKKPFWKFW